MTAEANERFVEKLDATSESGDIADPNIMHGDAAREGKRAE